MSHLDTVQPQDPIFYVRKRIALLGARAVGKTCLAIQCAHNTFEPEYMLTFEATYEWKTLIDEINYDITIVDTDGQDETTTFGPQYTIGVDAYILVFSVCDRESFNAVKIVNDKLLNILNVVYTKGTSEVPRILVGNQIDMPQRQVSASEARRYAEQQGIPYFETSACTAHNVQNLFTSLIQILQHNLRHPTFPDKLPQPPPLPSDTPPEQNNFCHVQ